MFSTLTVIAPVFALVLAGWLARRSGVLGAGAATELNRFVVYLALPAVLFDIVAHARWSDVWQPGFIAAFGLSVVVVFVLTVMARLKRQSLPDATLDGLSAAYGNTAYMGFPVLAAALGPSGLVTAMIATLITVCLLFAVAIVLIEAALQRAAKPHHLAMKVTGQLLRNPLVIAPLLGAAAAMTGLALPEAADKTIKILGGAASPCALVTIGLFLGGRRPAGEDKAPGQAASTAALVGLKLVLQPAIAFGAARLLRLPDLLAHSAVLLAALPTGTGPFMLAEFYRREAGVTSKAILLSTVGSAATLSVVLALTR